MSGTAIALFTRDLRLHDNPALAAACARAECVVPLFVLDPPAFAGPNRLDFLTECLHDLDDSLRRIGGRLVIRRGDVVAEVCKVAEQVNAATVHIAADVSGYAVRRERALRTALGNRRELVVHQGAHTVIEPGATTPAGGDHFAVFTPYWRRWAELPKRSVGRPVRRISLPRIAAGTLPSLPKKHDRLPGGESAARHRMSRWLQGGITDYADRHDLMAVDGTSRLSPYLHFGCLSTVELAQRGAKSTEFVRQLAWRDFHHQVLAARPAVARQDYRSRGDHWRDDPEALDAWQRGHTGFPIVDAGMRQLLAEGWMHNRARLITASFLSKTLYIDWRAGADHYFAHLLDGDVANNCLNWQWVAGTGTDTRPNRVLNPLRQAQRYDPDGDYVRKWVPELGDPSYPRPIVDLDEARRHFLNSRKR
jgi:deoxyribodipyrimidine photo-lyase